MSPTIFQRKSRSLSAVLMRSSLIFTQSSHCFCVSIVGMMCLICERHLHIFTEDGVAISHASLLLEAVLFPSWNYPDTHFIHLGCITLTGIMVMDYAVDCSGYACCYICKQLPTYQSQCHYIYFLKLPYIYVHVFIKIFYIL
jgi:hypothetical protein